MSKKENTNFKDIMNNPNYLGEKILDKRKKQTIIKTCK